MKNYIILFLVIFIISYFIYFSFFSYTIKEHYCKVSKYNKEGIPNNLDIKIDNINISNNNCDKYWKKFNYDDGSLLKLNEPIPIKNEELLLPNNSGQSNSLYKFGLINFNKLSKLLNDNNIDKNILDKSNYLLINPINKNKFKYQEDLDLFIINLNNKTDIKRYNEYNPVTNNYFKTIISPIKEINILNKEFLNRINIKQKDIVNKKDLLLNGLSNYQIYSYRIIDIKYINSNSNMPIFVLQINLFQEHNYYINCFSYIGFLQNNKPILINNNFIGVFPNSDFLNTPPNDPNDPNNFFILNKNFNDFKPRIDNMNEALKIIENKKKLDSLNSNYACFNTNFNSKQTILNYDNKTLCESSIDSFGRPKEVGIFDKPCEKNEECPYYKSNLNYKNDYGKCINGKCELPVNMKNIGYHYYSYDKNYKPLCYNCIESNNDNKEYNILSTTINNCCDDQFDKIKYPNLQSPDYVFENDIIKRINYFNKKNYKTKKLI